MNKVLILPDIHGRQFWKKPCENIDNYDKVVFLGDYLDPYNFEFISVEEIAVYGNSFNYEMVCDIGKRVPRLYSTTVVN